MKPAFSGTFFPVSNLPQWAQPLALVFPLYHLVELARWFGSGTKAMSGFWNIAYLPLFLLIFSFLGLKAMRKRLIL
ncbi:MAG: hypothetical protein PVI06_01165 [Desulfobacterales bacterium]|jgi:lipooligosaccharide transport system permease protein